jgi:hypothetical protein
MNPLRGDAGYSSSERDQRFRLRTLCAVYDAECWPANRQGRPKSSVRQVEQFLPVFDDHASSRSDRRFEIVLRRVLACILIDGQEETHAL